ncbi:hypothetical protein BKA65DRAFT_476182 [Rhexocercosporidium sp. MPI-PUGE-AT-0058]|nr:hypothetical protein BKA65DRAFT_476182 [Rhexocercosporidium sp. MPI-PUGE-AT-0058]
MSRRDSFLAFGEQLFHNPWAESANPSPIQPLGREPGSGSAPCPPPEPSELENTRRLTVEEVGVDPESGSLVAQNRGKDWHDLVWGYTNIFSTLSTNSVEFTATTIQSYK